MRRSMYSFVHKAFLISDIETLNKLIIFFLFLLVIRLNNYTKTFFTLKVSLTNFKLHTLVFVY